MIEILVSYFNSELFLIIVSQIIKMLYKMLFMFVYAHRLCHVGWFQNQYQFYNLIIICLCFKNASPQLFYN